MSRGLQRLMEAVREKNGIRSTSDTESLFHEISATELCEEPPTKQFCYLNRVFEARMKEGLNKP